MTPQNKGHREEITKRKFGQRVKLLAGLSREPLTGNKIYVWKHQGKPCSCWMCSPYKCSRKVKHKNTFED